jgi:hypothetical protein
MLGGNGRAALNPVSLPGSGGYGQERDILRAFGVEKSEFPLDAALMLGWLVLSMFGMIVSSWEHGDEMRFVSVLFFLPIFLLFGVMIFIALNRRRKLGRA